MQRVYLLAMLFDIFVRGMLPLQVGIDEFTSIRESRQRFAKIVQCLAAHDAVAVANPISMKCWKKACNLGKNSFSLTPSRKANTPLKLTDEISCICCAVVSLPIELLLQNAIMSIWELSTMSAAGLGRVGSFASL